MKQVCPKLKTARGNVEANHRKDQDIRNPKENGNPFFETLWMKLETPEGIEWAAMLKLIFLNMMADLEKKPKDV